MKKAIRIFLIIALLALIAIQFIRPDRSIPEYDTSQDFISMTNPNEQIKGILKAACYDCHSYETKYPWYDRIAPVSYWLNGHVRHGRGKLNFSEWGTYSAKKADHKLEESVEEVKGKNMPLSSYTWTHKEAKLSDEQRAELARFFQALRS